MKLKLSRVKFGRSLSFSSIFCSYIFCIQYKLWVEIFLFSLVYLTLYWGTCLTAECGIFRIQISLLCISPEITPIVYLVSSHSCSLAHPKGVPAFQEASCFDSFPWPSGPHLSLSTPVPDPVFPSLSSLPSSSLPSPSYECISPFWVRFNHAPLILPSLLASLGVWSVV